MQRHAERADAVRRKLHKLTNEVRDNAGCGPLSRDAELEEIANAYASRMAQRGELAHSVDGTTPQERASEFRHVGENLHREYAPRFSPHRTAQATVQAWLDSDGHRENLLRDRPSIGGFGVSVSGDTVYICHLIASPPSIGQKVTARVGSFLNSDS